MAFLRPLAGTDMQVSALGLGTVKLGRNQGVKYPRAFDLPDDDTVLHLLDVAHAQGINLIDTAPAYGSSEERLGSLLQDRHNWIIATKTGEEFSAGHSHFDFSAAHTRFSIERSLKRLRTDYLDIVLIHSDGNDLDILEHSDCVQTLVKCREEGLVRAIGMSTKTIEGGLRAIELLDLVMVTWNLQQQDTEVVAAARRLDRGVLVKKALMSGHVSTAEENLLQRSLENVLAEPGIASAIIGTVNAEHLQNNVEMAKRILETRPEHPFR